MLDTSLDLLKAVPLFDGLNDLQLAAIRSVGEQKAFAVGEKLTMAGESGQVAYLIVIGRASCQLAENGKNVEKEVGPGTLVAELAMLVETDHSITVVAKEPLRTLAIRRTALKPVLEADPAIAQKFADRLLERLQGLASDLRALDAKLADIENAA